MTIQHAGWEQSQVSSRNPKCSASPLAPEGGKVQKKRRPADVTANSFAGPQEYDVGVNPESPAGKQSGFPKEVADISYQRGEYIFRGKKKMGINA